MKRRVTSLPPITSEIFTEKVLAAQASSTAAASKASYEKTCGACEKTYFSENAYVNHVGSQKHRTRVAQLAAAKHSFRDNDASSVQSSYLEQSTVGQSDTVSESDEDISQTTENLKRANLKDGEGEAGDEVDKSSTISEADLRRCLFCNYESPTILLSVHHMERIHSMFIPERIYLVDLNGLLTSLMVKIGKYHECLYCGKLKPTIYGLQTHMRDKGHCKIPFATEDEQLEIGEFYDFTSTYSDVEDDDMEATDDESPRERTLAGKLGAKRVQRNGNDSDKMDEADGWETDSSASSLDSADLTAVPLDDRHHQYQKLDRHPHHSSQDPRPHRNRDGFHSHAHKHAQAVFYSDYELHLPSGRAVGHRSLARYYKQNLHAHPSPSERQEQLAIQGANGASQVESSEVTRANGRERGRALTSRANGGTGMVGVTDQKRREVQLAEKKARKLEERERRNFQWGVNKQGNFQKHFRVSLSYFLSYQIAADSSVGSSSSVIAYMLDLSTTRFCGGRCLLLMEVL